MSRSIGIITAFNPYIGYAKTTEIAQEALRSGRSVADLILEKKLLTKEQVAQILRPESLTKPAAPSAPHGGQKQRRTG